MSGIDIVKSIEADHRCEPVKIVLTTMQHNEENSR
jgi:hypothetical protein